MLSEIGMPYPEIKKWIIKRKQQKRPWTVMIDIHDQYCGDGNLEDDLDYSHEVKEIPEREEHLLSSPEGREVLAQMYQQECENASRGTYG